jgi:MFS family permease
VADRVVHHPGHLLGNAIAGAVQIGDLRPVSPDSAPGRGPVGVRALSRDSSYLLFLGSRTVSTIGAAMSSFVLALLAFDLTGSAILVSLVAAGSAIPYLVLGLFAGVIADRYPRRRLMVAMELLGAAAMALIPVAGLIGGLSGHLVLGVSLVTATLFVFFDAAAFGAVPALVGRSGLAAATGLMSMSFSISTVIGPMIGALLVVAVGAVTTTTFHAVAFVLSAIAILLIPRSFEMAAEQRSRTSFRQDLAAGLQFVRHNRLLRTLITLGAGISFADGMLKGILVVYAVRSLGLEKSSPAIGLLFAALAGGALLGGLITTTRPRGAQPRLMLGGMTVTPIAVFGMASANSIEVAVGAGFVAEVARILVVANGIVIRQQLAPDKLQGRVNVLGRMIAWGGTPFGAIVGGVVAELQPVTTVVLLAASAFGVTAIAGWCGPLREAALRPSSILLPAHQTGAITATTHRDDDDCHDREAHLLTAREPEAAIHD